MNKIFLGALACAAAGVVAYSLFPEKGKELLNDLKKKREDPQGDLAKGSGRVNDEAEASSWAES